MELPDIMRSGTPRQPDLAPKRLPPVPPRGREERVARAKAREEAKNPLPEQEGLMKSLLDGEIPLEHKTAEELEYYAQSMRAYFDGKQNKSTTPVILTLRKIEDVLKEKTTKSFDLPDPNMWAKAREEAKNPLPEQEGLMKSLLNGEIALEHKTAEELEYYAQSMRAYFDGKQNKSTTRVILTLRKIEDVIKDKTTKSFDLPDPNMLAKTRQEAKNSLSEQEGLMKSLLNGEIALEHKTAEELEYYARSMRAYFDGKQNKSTTRVIMTLRKIEDVIKDKTTKSFDLPDPNTWEFGQDRSVSSELPALTYSQKDGVIKSLLNDEISLENKTISELMTYRTLLTEANGKKPTMALNLKLQRVDYLIELQKGVNERKEHKIDWEPVALDTSLAESKAASRLRAVATAARTGNAKSVERLRALTGTYVTEEAPKEKISPLRVFENVCDPTKNRPQFAPLEKKTPMAALRNTILQLQSYIVFDEFIGKDFAGSSPEQIRQLFYARYQTRYRDAGLFIQHQGYDPKDLTDEIISRTIATSGKLDLLSWKGHSIASYKGNNRTAYFINSGDETGRHGFPKQNDSTPYFMCYGVVRIEGVDDDVYANFVKCNRSLNMIDGSMFYITCIPQLLMNKTNVYLDELPLDRPSLVDGKKVKGVGYPTQECGNCTFRSSSLGVLCGYLDMCDPEFKDAPTIVRNFTEWMHKVFIYEAMDFLNTANPGSKLDTDVIDAIAYRAYNMGKHLASLGANADSGQLWELLEAKYDESTKSDAVIDPVRKMPEPIDVKPLDEMKIGTMGSRPGIDLNKYTIVRNPQGMPKQNYTNIYQLYEWAKAGYKGAHFFDVDAYAIKGRDRGLILGFLLLSMLSLVNIPNDLKGSVTYDRQHQKDLILTSDCYSSKHDEITSYVIKNLKESRIWGGREMSRITAHYAEEHVGNVPANLNKCMQSLFSMYDRPDNALLWLQNILRLRQHLSLGMEVKDDKVRSKSNHFSSRYRNVSASAKTWEDLEVFLKKMDSCNFDIDGISISGDPYVTGCGFNFQFPLNVNYKINENPLISNDLSSGPIFNGTVTYASAFKKVVREKYPDQSDFESAIFKYLDTLSRKSVGLPDHVILHAVFACTYSWACMGYVDPGAVENYFSRNDYLLERILSIPEETVCPIREKSKKNMIERYRKGGDDYIEDKGDIQKYLMPYRSYMLLFLRGNHFDNLMGQLVESMFDPKNPYEFLFHVVNINEDVRVRFMQYMLTKSDMRGDFSTLVNGKNRIYGQFIDTVPHIMNFGLSGILKRQGVYYSPVKVVRSEVIHDVPYVHPYFMEHYAWHKDESAYVGTPKSHDIFEKTQYCLRVDDAGVRKCLGSVGMQTFNKTVMVCGTDCSHVMVKVESLKSSPVSSVLLDHLTQFCYEEDVVVWKRKDSPQDLDIELIPYKATISIRSDAIYLGYEYAFQDYGSRWTHDIANAFTIRKVSTGQYYVVVFERLIVDKVEAKKCFVDSVFSTGTSSVPIVDPKSEFLRALEPQYHVIPVHYSGSTLVPRTYRSMWAYHNACIIYNRTALALEVLPLLKSMERVNKYPLPAVELNGNWPLLAEALKPNFHPIESGNSAFGQVPPARVTVMGFKNIEALSEESGIPAAKQPRGANMNWLSQMCHSPAGADVLLSTNCKSCITKNTVEWIKSRMMVKQASGRVQRTGGELKYLKGILQDDHVQGYRSFDAEQGPPKAFMAKTCPVLGMPLKLATKCPERLLNYLGGTLPEGLRNADLMYFFIAGIIPRPDQLEVVAKVTADLSRTDPEKRSSVHPMLMGSGKTAVVTPMAIIHNHFSSAAPSVSLVLPAQLVTQSSTMLASMLAPHCLIQVIRSDEPVTVPQTGVCYVLEDSVYKRSIIERAGNSVVRSKSLHSACIFDEVDSLVNPLTSELNIPIRTLYEPDYPLGKLLMKIYDDTVGTESRWDDVPEIITRHYFKSVKIGLAGKKHRQHYGIAASNDYEKSGKTASAIAVPFAYADTPVIGSKYSDIIYSMACTAASYANSMLTKDNVVDLVDAVKGIITLHVTRLTDGCEDDVEDPVEAQILKSVMSERWSSVAKDADVERSWRNDPSIKRLFVELIVSKEFSLEIDMYNVTGIEMLMSGNGHRRSGFTGTPERMDTSKYDKDSVDFLEKRQYDIDKENVAISRLDTTIVNDILSDFVDMRKVRPNLRVLIDCGCMLVGMSAADVYLSLLEPGSKMLHWDKDEGPLLRTINRESGWDGTDDGDMLIYYAHANTTGIDAKLKPNTAGMITIGKDTRYRDFIQALYRLRQIDTTQTCTIAMTEDVAYRVGQGSTPSAADVVAWMKANDGRYAESQADLIESQCLRGAYRSDAKVLFNNLKSAFKVVEQSIVLASSKDRCIDKYRMFINEGFEDASEEDKSAMLAKVLKVPIDSSNTSFNQNENVQQKEKQEQDQEEERSRQMNSRIAGAYKNDVTLAVATGHVQMHPKFDVVGNTNVTVLCALVKYFYPHRQCRLMVTRRKDRSVFSLAMSSEEMVTAVTYLLSEPNPINAYKVDSCVIVYEDYKAGDRWLYRYGNNLPLSEAADIAASLRAAKWPAASVW